MPKLTKDEAAKIIARHGERGIDSAFFLLVDTLTEGEASNRARRLTDADVEAIRGFVALLSAALKP